MARVHGLIDDVAQGRGRPQRKPAVRPRTRATIPSRRSPALLASDGAPVLLRRAAGHRHRRRHDPGPAVLRPCSGRGRDPGVHPPTARRRDDLYKGGDGHQPAAVPALHRPHQAEDWKSVAVEAARSTSGLDAACAAHGRLSEPDRRGSHQAAFDTLCGATCWRGSPESPARDAGGAGRKMQLPARQPAACCGPAFDELCVQRRSGPQDYLAIAQRFHTVVPGRPCPAWTADRRTRRGGWWC